LARLFTAKPGLFLIVVPTDREAEDLASDLETLGVPALRFPWLGAMPYREMPPLSAVFGERTRVLSFLAGGFTGMVIVPERAFLTPLPPVDYIRDTLISLKPRGAIDTMGLAETLTRYGYTRTPRVQVHGEFALRGEVLDLFMGGDDTAYRILFDYDRIESIRSFDPLDQSGLAPVEEIRVRPLKEVVWTDDRVETLHRSLTEAEEFAGGGRAVQEELMTRRDTPGEEYLVPLAFEKPATL
jgi:transcription-repair coupling factor (superfamily II helicase)